MEWIRISDNKLKIMLTAEDAARYALQCEKADYADVMTRQAFREILTDVRGETGFDATEDKVYIQMYPSKEGGCELFVTKIGLLLTETNAAKSNAAPARQRVRERQRQSAFCFDGADPLIAVCRRLFATGYRGESEAWRDEDGRFWLLLREHGTMAASARDLGFIREYGRAENAEITRLYLPEHARAVCRRDAVRTLYNL